MVLTSFTRTEPSAREEEVHPRQPLAGQRLECASRELSDPLGDLVVRRSRARRGVSRRRGTSPRSRRTRARRTTTISATTLARRAGQTLATRARRTRSRAPRRAPRPGPSGRGDVLPRSPRRARQRPSTLVMPMLEPAARGLDEERLAERGNRLGVRRPGHSPSRADATTTYAPTGGPAAASSDLHVLLVHGRRRRASTPEPTYGNAGELEESLQRAVLAVRAVQQGKHDVDLAERLGHRPGSWTVSSRGSGSTASTRTAPVSSTLGKRSPVMAQLLRRRRRRAPSGLRW